MQYLFRLYKRQRWLPALAGPPLSPADQPGPVALCRRVGRRSAGPHRRWRTARARLSSPSVVPPDEPQPALHQHHGRGPVCPGGQLSRPRPAGPEGLSRRDFRRNGGRAGGLPGRPGSVHPAQRWAAPSVRSDAGRPSLLWHYFLRPGHADQVCFWLFKLVM